MKRDYGIRTLDPLKLSAQIRASEMSLGDISRVTGDRLNKTTLSKYVHGKLKTPSDRHRLWLCFALGVDWEAISTPLLIPEPRE